jgi:hypothetical protein
MCKWGPGPAARPKNDRAIELQSHRAAEKDDRRPREKTKEQRPKKEIVIIIEFEIQQVFRHLPVSASRSHSYLKRRGNFLSDD